MRESTALKALSILTRYVSANPAAQNNHMVVFVVEAAMYIAAKFDESGLLATFADFHAAVFDLPSFDDLLASAEVPREEVRWEEGMYALLEQSVLTTLGWKIDILSSIEVMATLLTVHARLCMDAMTQQNIVN